jgi:hypothetical protein
MVEVMLETFAAQLGRLLAGQQQLRAELLARLGQRSAVENAGRIAKGTTFEVRLQRER